MCHAFMQTTIENVQHMLETRMLNIPRYRKFKQRLINYHGVYVWTDDKGTSARSAV